MVFVTTITHKSGELEEFSKEKIAILLFENMCNIGEPNLNLAEKLAFLIFDKVNAKFSKEISQDKLDELIKEILLKENQTDLLQAYILKKNKFEINITDTEVKDKILKEILNIQDIENTSAKLISINATINKIQNNKFEKLNKKIFDYIREGAFYPNSTLLREISLNRHISSSYSFKIDDNLESIFDSLALASKVQKFGASISVDLSNVRSEKEKVKSINRNACGPVRVINLFVSAKSLLGYNINTANNLFYISIEHPDLVSFLNYSSTNQTDNFAILIPDRFMQALINDQEYFIEKDNGEKRKIQPTTLFELISSKIVTGDQINILFKDTINNKNPFNNDYKKYAISPIGFQPCFEDSTFLSGTIDVSKLVNTVGKTKVFDWLRLKTIIWDSLEFLDNTIDISEQVNEKFSQNLKETRQIYLSITGFSTLLSKLNISYDSDDVIYFADSLSDYISYYTKLRSTELAKDRGPFLKFIKSKYELPNFNFEKTPIQKTLFSTDLTQSKKLNKNMPAIDWTELKNNIKKYGLRNSTTFSIIFSDYYSIANECSNALEPLLSYKPTYWINGYKSEKINKEITAQVPDLNPNWSESELNSAIPDNIKSKNPLARTISPRFFIRLQSVFEKNTDGVVNLKTYFTENITVQDIKDLIIESHRIGNTCFIPEKLNHHIKDFNTENRKGIMSL